VPRLRASPNTQTVVHRNLAGTVFSALIRYNAHFGGSFSVALHSKPGGSSNGEEEGERKTATGYFAVHYRSDHRWRTFTAYSREHRRPRRSDSRQRSRVFPLARAIRQTESDARIEKPFRHVYERDSCCVPQGAAGRGKRMKTTCEKCGSVYKLTEHPQIMRDKDSLTCDVCGEEIYRWNGAVFYTSKLIQRGQVPPTSDSGQATRE